MNVRGLNAKLAALERGLMDGAQRAVAEAAVRAREDARALAPVQTGRLRTSIRAQSEGLHASVATECEYAPAVEFGTRYAPPQAFMRSAAASARERLRRDARRLALEEIRRAAR